MSLTISDVAHMAGVSHQTVSKVLNSKGYVGAETRERVLRICREVGYVPNAHARQLAGGRNLTVGVAFFHQEPSFTQPFYVRMFQGIIDELSRVERDILLAHMRLPRDVSSDAIEVERSIGRFRNFLRSGHAGSVLLIGDLRDEHFEVLRDSRLPAVYVGCYDVPAFLEQVDIDIAGCCRLLIEALTKRGYRRAFFCHVPDERKQHLLNWDLWEAFRPQALAAGIQAETIGYDPASVCRKAAESGRASRAAVVCVNDEVAANVITVAKASRLSIPEAFGVTGLGNHAVAQAVSPAITTVDFRYEEMGQRAVRRLLDRPAEGAPRHESLQGALVTRESI